MARLSRGQIWTATYEGFRKPRLVLILSINAINDLCPDVLAIPITPKPGPVVRSPAEPRPAGSAQRRGTNSWPGSGSMGINGLLEVRRVRNDRVRIGPDYTSAVVSVRASAAPPARFLLRCPRESRPQPRPVDHGTSQIDRVDLPCVGNVVQRVRIEDDEVGTLAGYDRADVAYLQ